ncbi:MAG: DUF1499 domain-containing protein [Rhodobacterales bacterium]|nr:DUF1499 domain-containing protein [Rhodobacterales bacterium]
MKWLALALILALLGAGAWVRLAPAAPADWHADPRSAPDPATPNFARLVLDLPLPPDQAAGRLAAAMAALPRTRLFAGDPAAGLATWESRSALWGFPDYTSAAIDPTATGSRLTLLARARFGQSDLGVNAARLARIRAALLP